MSARKPFRRFRDSHKSLFCSRSTGREWLRDASQRHFLCLSLERGLELICFPTKTGLDGCDPTCGCCFDVFSSKETMPMVHELGDLVIVSCRVMAARMLQGAASVSETQAFIRARSTLELATLSESRISLTRQCLRCLSRFRTASSVNGATRVDCLTCLGDAFSASVAVSRSHCNPLEKSKVLSSLQAGTVGFSCSNRLARAFVSFERPRVLGSGMGFEGLTRFW